MCCFILDPNRLPYPSALLVLTWRHWFLQHYNTAQLQRYTASAASSCHATLPKYHQALALIFLSHSVL